MNKSWTTLIYLSVIFGYLGVDRFYTGKIVTGILKLLTLGGYGIWWIIDIIVVASGKFTEASGKLIEKPENAKKHIGVSIGVLVLLFVTGIILNVTGNNPTVNAINAANEIAETRAKVNAANAANEIAKAEAKAKEKLFPIELSASQLYKAYKDNEIAADKAYKEKWIKVSGKISSIGKNFKNMPFVSLNTGKTAQDLVADLGNGDIASAQAAMRTIQGIDVYFEDDNELVNFKKGQNITVVGKCYGKDGINLTIKEAFFEK